MDWKEIVKLEKWVPLSSVDIGGTELKDGFYKVTETIYYNTTEYDSTFENEEKGPYIPMFLWAPSEGAARRAMLDEIEKDDGITLPPPIELLPHPTCNTMGLIENKIKEMGYKYGGRGAIYRAKDGAFVHQTLGTNVAEYYFRSREHNNHDEIPYAIRWRMVGYDKLKTGR